MVACINKWHLDRASPEINGDYIIFNFAKHFLLSIEQTEKSQVIFKLYYI